METDDVNSKMHKAQKKGKVVCTASHQCDHPLNEEQVDGENKNPF